MTSTQKNLLGNLTSQALTLTMGVVCLPRIAGILGIEAYGLVGVLWALQSMAVLLDFGWGVAANRELARLSASMDNSRPMRSIVTTLGRWYVVGAVAVGGALWYFGPKAGAMWLTPRALSERDIGCAMQVIGIIVALQIPIAFYSSCAMGMQKMVLVSIIRSFVVIGNYPGAIAVLYLGAPTIRCYLAVQAVVAFLQLLATFSVAWLSIPRPDQPEKEVAVDWRSLGQFASGVFGISLTGLLLSQGDKLLLSKVLTLDQFGYYSLAATVSVGLLSLGQPVFAVVLPRFSQLLGARNHEAMTIMYHQASQFLGVLVIPVGVTLACFPAETLLAWTGKSDVVAHATETLRWLAVGSTLIAMTNVVYAMQLAHGWTRLLLVTNGLAVLVVLPLMAILASKYGGVGAAFAWVGLGAGHVFVAIPAMHRRLFSGGSRLWLWEDVMHPLIPALASSLLFRATLPVTTRIQSLIALVVTLVVAYLAAFACTGTTRQWAHYVLARKWHTSDS